MMRTRLPASRGGLRARVSIFDTIWAFGSPLLALYFCDAYILSYGGLITALLYCLISAAFALVAFLLFRLLGLVVMAAVWKASVLSSVPEKPRVKMAIFPFHATGRRTWNLTWARIKPWM